eukprot:CAMPEP_0204902356 /NCGR_PEP_ID=MMETSP1397-20131031/3620_1 /ASSEMBLY_ACC=CAM_ASM_000891 /TAXON_ID=49980 /ORGANISM="Climacostomum Climacostomum virens, Strain Stock W-24" /LENGTH=888 /DNA_ID=CAMNT_0052070851 /DNA_START=664 /DNA_END=3326 /DNA_ORIENTATION=-
MLCDKLYSESLRAERLKEVRRQEAELARKNSKAFTTLKKVEQVTQIREESLLSYREKLLMYQELEKQRESLYDQIGAAHRQAEAKEREDGEKARERDEWLRQAADRAAERGRSALSQAVKSAKARKEEETYIQRRRQEVLNLETLKAQQLAAAWQDKQYLEAQQKAADDAANYVPPGGLVVKGQLDFTKTHFHNPVILKHELTQKPAQDVAAETEAEAEVRAQEKRSLQEEQRRIAAERGIEAMTKEELKIQKDILLAELEKIRKADGENKAKLGAAKEQSAASRVSLTNAKKEALKKQRAEKQFQEIFLSNGKSSILESVNPVNVWEPKKQEYETNAISLPAVPIDKGPPKKLVIKEGENVDPFASLVSSFKSQTEVLPKKPHPEKKPAPEKSYVPAKRPAPEKSYVPVKKPLESPQIPEDDEEDYKESEASSEEDAEEEAEEIHESDTEESVPDKDDDFEYSEASSESEYEEEKLPAKYTAPSWKMSKTKKQDDDALIEELTSKDPEIKQIWGEVKGATGTYKYTDPIYKSRSETLDRDSSSSQSSPASSFSKPPVPKLGKGTQQKTEQYYSDLLTTPAFSKNQPTFRPTEEDQKDTRDLGAYSAVKSNLKESLLSESFTSLLNSRSTGHKSQEFEKYLRSEPSDTFKLSQTDDLKYSRTESRVPGDTQDKIDDIEELLRSKKKEKSSSWEIDNKPQKRRVPEKESRYERQDDPVNVLAEYSSKRVPQKEQGKSGESWNIGDDTGTEKASLAEAFLAKKRALAGKLEHRELKAKDQPKKEKSKEELLAIRKEMLKGSKRSKVIDVEVKKTVPANAKLMERLAMGERTKVTKDEMKTLTAKNYDRLPEVKAKKEKEAKQAEIKKRIANAKEFEKKRKESRLKRIASP